MESFEEVEEVLVHTSDYSMPYENNIPIFIAKRMKVPISYAWERLKNYDWFGIHQIWYQHRDAETQRIHIIIDDTYRIFFNCFKKEILNILKLIINKKVFKSTFSVPLCLCVGFC